MGRKKEDREAKADHKKARRLAKEAENDEDDSISLAHQLAPLGKAKIGPVAEIRRQYVFGKSLRWSDVLVCFKSQRCIMR